MANPVEYPNIDVDLVKSSRSLLNLLIAVDTFPYGGLYDGAYAYEAVRRYLDVFMPMMAAAKTAEERANLIPPLDVAWVWFVHRLCPASYTKDCVQLWGKEIHPEAEDQAFCFGDGSSGSNSRHMPGRWTAQIKMTSGSIVARKEGDEYWPPTPMSTQICLQPLSKSIARAWPEKVVREALAELRDDPSANRPRDGCYDLITAMKRQAGFLRHCLRAAYCEEPFLCRALDRYQRFLVLWKENPGMPLVPMYDIDLMWHAHMAHSRVYNKDLISYNGRILLHDDTIEDTKLKDGFSITKAAFESRFDMLYDPPLTQKVPSSGEHPAVKYMGTKLVSLLGPFGTTKLEILNDREQLRTDYYKVQNALNSSHPKLSYTDRRTMINEYKNKVRVMKSKHSAMIAKKDPGLPKRLPRNGGYALYFAYMLNEAHKKANSSLLHKARALTLGPQAGVLDYKMRYAAKLMVPHVQKMLAWDSRYGPFRSDHPFFTCLALLPYDSPATLWRTPPGSAPGTLSRAQEMAKELKGLAEPVLGVPANLSIGVPAAVSESATNRNRGAAEWNHVKSNYMTNTRNQGSNTPGQPSIYTSTGYDCYMPWLVDNLWLNAAWAEHCCNTGYIPYDMAALGPSLCASQDASNAAQQQMQDLAGSDDVSQCHAAASLSNNMVVTPGTWDCVDITMPSGGFIDCSIPDVFGGASMGCDVDSGLSLNLPSGLDGSTFAACTTSTYSSYATSTYSSSGGGGSTCGTSTYSSSGGGGGSTCGTSTYSSSGGGGGSTCSNGSSCSGGGCGGGGC